MTYQVTREEAIEVIGRYLATPRTREDLRQQISWSLIDRMEERDLNAAFHAMFDAGDIREAFTYGSQVYYVNTDDFEVPQVRDADVDAATFRARHRQYVEFMTSMYDA